MQKADIAINSYNTDGATFSSEVEKGLIASLIFDNNNIDETNFLIGDHFYDPFHGFAFETIRSIINKDRIADLGSVTYEMTQKVEEANKHTIADRLAETLAQNFSYTTTAGKQARVIYEFYIKRKLSSIGQKIFEEAQSCSVFDIYELLNKYSEEIFAIHEPLSDKSFLSIADHITQVMKMLNIARKRETKISGIPFGFKSIDDILCGMKTGDLIIIAARPSMGKTALALSVAYRIAKHMQQEAQSKRENSCSVGFFSLEMSGEQIATRLAAIHTQKNSKVFETGRIFNDKFSFITEKPVSDAEFAEIMETVKELDQLPLYIDSTPAMSISALRARIRKSSKKKNLKVAIVDYLQLLKGDYNTSANRVQEISEISQGLKNIAKEMRIPVIALSQLSRAVESREDKRPHLSDLRDSGSIEQDADIVMLLYREAYYLSRSTPQEPGERYTDPILAMSWEADKKKYEDHMRKLAAVDNLAEIIIAKNRNGPTGTVNLAFEKSNVSFSERVREDDPTVQEYSGIIHNPNHNPFTKKTLTQG